MRFTARTFSTGPARSSVREWGHEVHRLSPTAYLLMVAIVSLASGATTNKLPTPGRGEAATSPFFAHVGLAQGGRCAEAFAGAAGGEDDKDEDGEQVREHGEELGGQQVDAGGL